MSLYRITYRRSIFNVLRVHITDDLNVLKLSDKEQIKKIEKISERWYGWHGTFLWVFIILSVCVSLYLTGQLETFMPKRSLGNWSLATFFMFVGFFTWLWHKINRFFEAPEDITDKVQLPNQTENRISIGNIIKELFKQEILEEEIQDSHVALPKVDKIENVVQCKEQEEPEQTTMSFGYEQSQSETNQNIQKLEITEEKKVANHKAYEGRISAKDKKTIKRVLGSRCMACGKDMTETYGVMGKDYIELHHLVPYSKMAQNDTRTLTPSEFCVLCPDCHRMIHRLADAGDIAMLRNIIKERRNHKEKDIK